jgi:ribosomal protein L16 Arg81 hydroxylase
VLPTAAPTPKGTTAEPTARPDRVSVLSRCIATDPQTFATEYWGRRPLLSPSDALPRDFGDLLSADTVDELIAERGVRAPFIRLAKDGSVLAKDCYLGPAGFGAEVPDQVDAAKVLEQLAAGATIVLQGLHRLWPPLIEFVRQAVDDLGHPVQANAYITPPTSRGFDPHYDVHDVFVLQVAGQKRWIVHEPVHVHPLPSQPWTHHRASIAERVTGAPVIDTVLSEGDALYLPRGWIHSAKALETTSIHLTVGASPLTGIDVARAVIGELATLDGFRKSLPMGRDPGDQDEIIATVTKVMAEMVGALRDDASALSVGAAQKLVNRHADQTRPAAVRPLASLLAGEQADTATVQWRRGLVSTIDRSGGHVVVRLSGKVLTLPMSCADAVAALRNGQVADAASLPGLDHADGTVLIRRLLREAVVVPVKG